MFLNVYKMKREQYKFSQSNIADWRGPWGLNLKLLVSGMSLYELNVL